jgi:hypothetical protein
MAGQVGVPTSSRRDGSRAHPGTWGWRAGLTDPPVQLLYRDLLIEGTLWRFDP